MNNHKMTTLNTLLLNAVAHKASDLHLSSGMPTLIRVDGTMKILHEEILEATALEQMLSTIMSQSQQQTFAQTGDIDFAYAIDTTRFRVNVYRQLRGIAATCRIIANQIPTLESLHLPDIFRELSTKEHGLILITGPTGSGKSSSLAALINHINQTTAKHIITIEDPIEFVHSCQQSLISQREIGKDTASFQQALRAALREDPDIISVAELRDLETIRLALTAAETGHLVLATLHTASATKTIDRIIDVFPGNEKDMIRTMLSESLLAVVAQRLRPKEAGGRYAEFEILVAAPAIRHLIRENKTTQIYSAMQTGAAAGMCTFEQYSQFNKP
jgi:twitching motility protein PilT